MDLLQKIIQIIGSKWFVFFLGVGMIFAIPPTWAGVKLNPAPLTIIVFLMAIITCGLAFYKFANMFWTQRKSPIEDKNW